MRSFLVERKIWLLTWLTGLVLLLQVFNLHSYVVSAVDHQAVVAATDDDASWNIAKTVKTRWWKDNGWVLYGPFYFRLNHSIQYFWERTTNPSENGASEAWERTAHHAILTVSLLSVVAVSLLIGSALLQPWWARFLFATAMNAAFLSNASRAEFVLRAHPDHLFTFFVVAALWLTVLMFFRPGEVIWQKLSATLWGFSMAVKMTLALCAPGFLFLFIPPLRRENFVRGLKYLGMMMLAYFLIGFPQTIVLDRPFRDLATQSGLSIPATLASRLHWLEVFGAQLWAPLLVLVLAWAILGESRRWPTASGWKRLTIFVAIPFLVLLNKNLLVPADHYPIPFVAMLVLLVAFAMTKLPVCRGDRFLLLRVASFFALTMAIWGSTPQAMQAALAKNLACRDQARETYQQLLKMYEAGEKIWVDPYVPYFSAADQSRMELSWDKTWAGYASGHWTVIALNDGYRGRFINGDEPAAYTKTEHTGWKDVREFYSAFKEGDTARTPGGDSFKRVYKNTCGQEIWKLERGVNP